jgi:hypothetical protein
MDVNSNAKGKKINAQPGLAPRRIARKKRLIKLKRKLTVSTPITDRGKISLGTCTFLRYPSERISEFDPPRRLFDIKFQGSKPLIIYKPKSEKLNPYIDEKTTARMAIVNRGFNKLHIKPMAERRYLDRKFVFTRLYSTKRYCMTSLMLFMK